MTIEKRSVERILFGFVALFVVLLPLYPSYPAGFVVKAIRAAPYVIIITYYLAQRAITHTFLEGARGLG